MVETKGASKEGTKSHEVQNIDDLVSKYINSDNVDLNVKVKPATKDELVDANASQKSSMFGGFHLVQNLYDLMAKYIYT